MKVTPVNNKLKTDVRILKDPSICLCKTLRPLFIVARLAGIFPMKWYHKNNRCTYEKSFPWLLYTFLVISSHLFYLLVAIDYGNILKNKSLILLLDDVTNAIYGIYILCLSLVTVFGYKKWIKSLDKLTNALRDGLLCQSAMKTAIATQYGIILCYFLILVIYFTVTIWYVLTYNYQSNFTDNTRLLYRIFHNITFFFYAQFIGMIGVICAILACFEKLTISCLQIKPVLPMKDIDNTNNTNDFLGFINYKLCKGSHPPLQKLTTFTSAETIEYLRILHEDICSCIYSLNEALNPQLLLSTVVELAVLIIHWYAVIAYLVYTFKHPMSRIIHIWNCLFVVLHSCGMYVYLKTAQHLKNMISGLITCLLEYSTSLVSMEEHQQVRMFIEKLKHHRPFTASGVFNVDLGIAGPISANILTYVLVALQFEIPKE